MKNKLIGDATDKQIYLIKNMKKHLENCFELPPNISKETTEGVMSKQLASDIISLNMDTYLLEMSLWHEGLDQYSCKDA